MTADPLPAVHALIGALHASRGRQAIVFHTALADDTVPILYECLRRAGPADGLDLVLVTAGGAVTAARQIAMLLREFTSDLVILVPHQARSAGTLLCLSANRLVLGPLAELGPVDCMMGSAGVPAPDTPAAISAEDVRAFRDLAEDWFGVERTEDRLQLLALLATRIFPTSLAALYRSEKLVREIAAELLEYQLAGDMHQAERKRIVDRLVGGYHSHEVRLSRRDARELGLRAVDATPQEEEILWALSRAVARNPRLPAPQPVEQVTGVIAAPGFGARLVFRRTQPADTEAPAAPPGQPALTTVEWEIAD